MQRTKGVVAALALVTAALAAAASLVQAQTAGEPEEFTAIAIETSDLGAGAGRVRIRITRWSTDAERRDVVNTLQRDGPQALLRKLQDARSVGTIDAPGTLAYHLRYAQQEPTDEGGRSIVIATDRPIGFWEQRTGSRTLDYPFTVIQMEIGRDGRGKGTISYATKIIPAGDDTIVLENFATSPVMLTEIERTSGGR